MARNKHPEETVNLILDVATKMFLERGYENTSIQDIINGLGGLSKGAIYHHFKSKEDILEAVTHRMSAESNKNLLKICNIPDLNGSEKLKAIIKQSVCDPVEKDIFTVAPNFHNNPELLFRFLKECVEVIAPSYLLPIIKQGMADGSIHTSSPEELSELIILALNIWINPMIFDSDPDKTYRKIILFGELLKNCGLDILDDEISNRLKELASVYRQKK